METKGYRVTQTRPKDAPWHVVELDQPLTPGARKLISPRGGLIRYAQGFVTRCGKEIGGHWHGGFKDNTARGQCVECGAP